MAGSFAVTMILAMGLATTEAFLIARLGTQPLAAFSIALPATIGITNIALGYSFAVGGAVARHFGSERLSSTTLARHSVLLGVLLGTTVGVMGWLAADYWSESGTLALTSAAYLRIWLFCTPFVFGMLTCAAVLRALGDSSSPAYISLGATALTVGLDITLMFGAFGLPGLGLIGAAWASVVSRALGFGVSLYLLNQKLKESTWSDSSASGPQLIIDLLKISIPVMAVQLLPIMLITVLTTSLHTFGQEALAGYGFVSRLDLFLTIPLAALAAATAPIVGQNLGSQNYTRITETVRIASGLSILVGLLLGCLIAISAPLIANSIRVFISISPQALEVVILYLSIIPLGWAFNNLSIITFQVLGATGHTKIAAFVSAFGLSVASTGAYLTSSTSICRLFLTLLLCNSVTGVISVLLLFRILAKGEKLAARELTR